MAISLNHRCPTIHRFSTSPMWWTTAWASTTRCMASFQDTNNKGLKASIISLRLGKCPFNRDNRIWSNKDTCSTCSSRSSQLKINSEDRKSNLTIATIELIRIASSKRHKIQIINQERQIRVRISKFKVSYRTTLNVDRKLRAGGKLTTSKFLSISSNMNSTKLLLHSNSNQMHITVTPDIQTSNS